MNVKFANERSTTITALMSDAAGVFTWDLETDVVHADDIVAHFFGIDIEEAHTGLPIDVYMQRMHTDDRPRVAKAIHAAIVSGLPYHQEYRVVQIDGTERWVLAVGHCFRNKNGVPSDYAGMMFDVTSQKTTATDGLLDHCLATLAVAEKVGHHRVIALLQEAVAEVLEENIREDVQKSMAH